jgi:hypothetical protein
MARPAAHDPERVWDGNHDYLVTYLQWNDHKWTPTRTMRAGTLGSVYNKASANPYVPSRDDDWLRPLRRDLRPNGTERMSKLIDYSSVSDSAIHISVNTHFE